MSYRLSSVILSAAIVIFATVATTARGAVVQPLTTTGAGSITIPAGYAWTDVTVQCWGGGGGGGGSCFYNYYGQTQAWGNGSGGGGGAYAYKTYTMLFPGTHSYYIGSGGTAGDVNGSGGAGENTIWNYGGNQNVQAGGGSGGYYVQSLVNNKHYDYSVGGAGGSVVAGSGSTGGAGGTSYIEYLFHGITVWPGGGGGGSGGPSGAGVTGSLPQGGSGFASGGDGAISYAYASATAGSFPGGGGGGGGAKYQGSLYPGAAGANGKISITYTPQALATIVLNAQDATIITGGTGTLGATVGNSASSDLNLNFNLNATVQSGYATLGSVIPASGNLAPGASQPCTVSAISTNIGTNTISFTASDPNASKGSQTTVATLTVLDHAVAAFAGGTSTLNLDFGTLQAGTGTHSLKYQIQNLLADYRAKLDLDSLAEIADVGGVFSTNAVPFSNLPSGNLSSFFDVSLDTATLGNFSGIYHLNLSDQKNLDGHAGLQTLTLNVTGNVVPEPSTLALLAAGAIGFIGWAWRRRRSVTL